MNSPNRESSEYKLAASETKRQLEIMQLCFANMHICMKMCRVSGDITHEQIDTFKREVADKMKTISDRLFDNDNSSTGTQAIVDLGKALSEDFLMDYFASKKNGRLEKDSI
jgi:hypothetical protein